LVVKFVLPAGGVSTIAYSPDGKRLAVGAREADKPGEVTVWDTTKYCRSKPEK
jgi:hypothetical protein